VGAGLRGRSNGQIGLKASFLRSQAEIGIRLAEPSVSGSLGN